MNQVYLIYGNEPQLIEEEKQKFFLSHKNLDVRVLYDEAGHSKISEQLMEDSFIWRCQGILSYQSTYLEKSRAKRESRMGCTGRVTDELYR